MRSPYHDIIALPHPVSRRRSRMTNGDRAAQFSPFAALTGFDDTIEEAGRLTDSRIELDEGEQLVLNEKLQELLAVIDTRPRVTLTHFVYDQKKAGGAYVRTTGCVKKIDPVYQVILLTDGRSIPISEIVDIACTEGRRGKE